MQNISILAFPVQDLTIARYLAAANIHFIAIDINKIQISDISSTTIQIQLKDQILDFEKFDKLNPTNPFTWIEVKASEVLGIYDFEEIEATLLSLGVEL